MSTTVTFDSVSLQNINKVVKSARHDSAPNREIEILPLARNEGGVFVSEHYQSKAIRISGMIKASNQANLETEIDSFKELLSRKNKNLDISYAGGTRRYVAYSRSVNIDRDFFHLNFAPYDIEFIVPAGIGKDTSVTAALDAVSADPTYSGSVTFSGSAEPKPVIKLTLGSGWTNAYGIKFENTDTEEECIVNYSDGFSDGDVLEIDCANKKVELNGGEIEFYRVFPSFIIGSSNIKIKAGDLIDQQFDSAANETAIGALGTSSIANGNDYPAQSFSVTHTDATYQGLMLRIGRGTGLGTANFDVEIQTDSNGEPSGTAVTNATFTLLLADLTTSYAWVTINSANRFELSANTIYWIVIMPVGDASNVFGKWSTVKGAEATYGRGCAAYTLDGGSTWTRETTWDRGFKLLYGGKVDSPGGTLTLDIDYTKRYL